MWPAAAGHTYGDSAYVPAAGDLTFVHGVFELSHDLISEACDFAKAAAACEFDMCLTARS